MKNKKFIMYFIILFIMVVIIIVGYYIFNKSKNKNNFYEFIPEEEITEEQLRQTIITLYFLNANTNELDIETRIIDPKLLINNPYDFLINLLIEGPNNENLKRLIPEGTQLINTKIVDDILFIDFSKEFILDTNYGKNMEEQILQSIVNTVTELTEINKIKILIDGEEGKSFSDGEVSFDKIFIKN